MNAHELPHANAREGLLWRDTTTLEVDALATLAESLPDMAEIRAALIVADEALKDEREQLYARELVDELVGAAARAAAEAVAERIRDEMMASADRSRLFATPAETVANFDERAPWGEWVDEAITSALDGAI